jgi:hypothetical protein
MKRYIKAKTFYRFQQRIDVERSIKILTLKDFYGADYNKDSYSFVDDEGNSWGYDSINDYNGRAITSFGKLLQETNTGDTLRVSAYFIASPSSRYSGIIYNPRLVR